MRQVRTCGGRRRGEFASLVNPGMPVPPGIADLTGITDWMLAAAPRLGAVLPGLLDFARDCVLVAHNAPFDLGFLVAGCGDLGLAWPSFTVLDTVMLARHVMDPDEVPDCKLGTLAGFFGARTSPNHRALADARATADVLSWLIRRLAHRGIRTLSQLSAWPDVLTSSLALSREIPAYRYHIWIHDQYQGYRAETYRVVLSFHLVPVNQGPTRNVTVVGLNYGKIMGRARGA